MEPQEYTATFNRLSKTLGATVARQIVDELDEERTAAKAETKHARDRAHPFDCPSAGRAVSEIL